MTFTQDLIQQAEPYWAMQMQKPFVREMIDGSLAPEQLRYWVLVDYPYLINFSKILSLGVLKAPTFEAMNLVQRYLNYIMTDEMASHERFAATQGITLSQLENHKMGPTKYAYAQHEFATASRGDLPEILTAVMPCLFGWQILSKRILTEFSIADDNPYKWWFDTYGNDSSLDGHVNDLLDLVDRMVPALPKVRQEHLVEIFLTSEYYETTAWDAYYSMEEWSTPDSNRA